MNDRDLRRFERALRVKTFGVNHAADFKPASIVRQKLVTLNGELVALEAAKADQQPDRVSKATLLEAIKLDLQAIARTAGAIALHEIGFEAPYRRPPGGLTEDLLVTHADAVLKRLETTATDGPAEQAAKTALRQRFIDYELPEDFVADLRADREEVRAANAVNQTETQDGMQSTRQISEILTRVSLLVDEMDAPIRNRYAREPETLHVWLRTSRVERAPRSGKAAPVAPPTGVVAPAAGG